jgi:N-acyl homoserine lactone hydrolase
VRIDLLIDGFPGSSPSNGGMGWSSVSLVRGGGRTVLIDTGPFGVRDMLRRRLAAQGVTPGEVTDVILTHCHHDHSVNWPMFPQARVFLSRAELEWGLQVPHGSSPVPELYVQELSARQSTVLLSDLDEVAPGIRTEVVPGHTPGSLIVTVKHGGTTTLFLGDAAKNRAELVSQRAEATLDQASSKASIGVIWQRWREITGAVVVPGHDLPIALAGGECQYLRSREARVQARLSADFDELTMFQLAGES